MSKAIHTSALMFSMQMQSFLTHFNLITKECIIKDDNYYLNLQNYSDKEIDKLLYKLISIDWIS